jgi:hypothetical protein
MKFTFSFLCLFFHLTFAHAQSPGVSGSLSIIPGLGQAVNGNGLEGVAWFGSVAGLMITNSRRTRQIGFDLWMYNMYDAYRDKSRKQTTFIGDYFASYNPVNAIDWIGTPMVAVAATTANPSNITPERVVEMSFVGLGEEGLFRGFLFPSLSQTFNSKWIGATISSAAFSLVHLDGSKPIPMRFLMGMLFCWQTNNNRGDIKKSIFAHTWWDVFVTSKDSSKVDGLSYNIEYKF